MSILANLKSRMPTIPQDLANHEVYGARIAAITASVTAALVAAVPHWAGLKLPALSVAAAALTVAGVAAIVAALVSGKLGERADADANEEGGARQVSGKDADHTAVGGVVVAVPLLMAAAVVVALGSI
jgi:hypothetical protein